MAVDIGKTVQWVRCIDCDTVKPATAFYYRAKGKLNGLSSYCKACTKERRKAYHRAYQRAFGRLRDLHKAEFAGLLAEELAQ